MGGIVYTCSDPGLEDVRIGVEICEDLWVPNPVSYTHLDVYKRQGYTFDPDLSQGDAKGQTLVFMRG